jgi:hypothetical protein
VLKMDTKFDCEVDVEGAVDMMDREEGASISRRPCLRPSTLVQPPAHEPQATNAWRLWVTGIPMLRSRKCPKII